MKISKKLVNFNAFVKYRKFQSNIPKTPEELKIMQFQKLKRLLSFAYSNYDFYRELMDGARFDPARFSNLEELSLLPVVTKTDYRGFIEYQLKKHPKKYEQYFKDHTSGSTGIPLVVYRTWEERAYLLSKFLRAFFNNGYNIFDTTFGILAPTRYSGSDSILQRLGVMSRIQAPFTHSAEKLTEMFLASKADVLYGNVTSLVQMANYINQNNISIKPLKFYLTTGEVLDKKSAVTVEMAYGNNIINHYGSIELSSLAYCKKGEKYFRFYHDTNLLEVLDKNDQPAEVGSNVVTDFHIYSFPMIRYKLGDHIESEMKDGFPAITRIGGRKEDLVVMKDGSEKSPFFLFEVFGTNPLVIQYKVVQEEWNLFNAELVITDHSKKENLKEDAMKRFRHYMDDEINLNITYVDEIAPESSGKLAKFFSKVSKTRISN